MTFPKSLTTLPLFDDLINACAGQTECSPSFIFSAGMAATCSILGRRVGMESFPDPLYPVWYGVLCAESGGSRKSSALKFAKKLLHLSDANVHRINRFTTAEALIRTLALPAYRVHGGAWDMPADVTDEDEFKKKASSYKSGIDKYVPQASRVEKMLEASSDTEGFRSIAIIDELMSFLKKSQNKVSAGVKPLLCELFSSPDKIDNDTSDSAVSAEKPHLCFIGAIPQAWLNRNYRLEDIEGGFGRRLQFISDSPVAPIAFPGPPHLEPLTAAVERLKVLRERFDASTLPVIFEFTKEAKEQHREWYKAFHEEKKGLTDDAMKAIVEGADTHIRVACLLFAALDPKTKPENPKIELKHWGFAKDWSDFVRECQESIFSNFTVSAIHEVEQRIVKKILDGKPHSVRSLYRSLHISAEDCRKVLDNFYITKQIRYLDDDLKTIIWEDD